MSLTFPAVAVPCLGEGEYEVIVEHRPTPKYPYGGRIGALPVSALNWQRTINATSVADVTVAVTGTDEFSACCDVVNQIDPIRTNMVIYRDDEPVWLGVVISKAYDGDTNEVTIVANDLSIWMEWRLFTHAMAPRKMDLADIFVGYLNYGLRGEMPSFAKLTKADPPLYVDDPGLIFDVTPTGVLGDRTIAAKDLSQLSTQISDLASTGVDWTVTNNKMWIGSAELTVEGSVPKSSLALPDHITDEFFGSAPRNRVTGLGMVTDAYVRGNGSTGHSGGPDDDGLLIQRVIDAFTIEDTASAEAAARSYKDLSGVPLTYVEGNNDLLPSCPIDVQTLIPGSRVWVDLAGGGCVPFAGQLRLEAVDASLGADGESIRLTIQPLGTTFDGRGPS